MEVEEEGGGGGPGGARVVGRVVVVLTLVCHRVCLVHPSFIPPSPRQVYAHRLPWMEQVSHRVTHQGHSSTLNP